MNRRRKWIKYWYLTWSYLNRGLPGYMVFFITARCNGKCDHCFYWRNIENCNASDELSLEEISRISRSNRYLTQISLTGGEPFLREDLSEVIRLFHRNTNTRFFTISSNGSLTSRMREVLEQVLPEMDDTFFRINLSCDGTECEHDNIKGIPGLTTKLRNTVRMLTELRQRFPHLEINMTTTMTRANQERLDHIYSFIKENFDVDEWCISLIRGQPRRADLADVTMGYYSAMVATLKKSFNRGPWLSRQLHRIMLYEHVLIERIVQQKQQIIPCLAGTKMIVLRENGDVAPCEMLDSFLGQEACFGNIRDYHFRIMELLSHRRARKILKFIADKKCHCTWECALNCSIFFNPRVLSKIQFNALLQPD